MFNSLRSQFFIAFRYIFWRTSKGDRYLLAAAFGIALSLVPIMVTLIVADGMIQGITERFLELGTGHIQVHQFGAPAPGGAMDAEKAKVAAAKGVRGVWSEIDGFGIILGAQGKTGTALRAIEPSFWDDPGSRQFLTVLDGSGNLQDDHDVLLGAALAESTGAKPGGKLRVMTVQTDADGRTLPRTALFNVRGIVSSGYHEIDKMWCIISYEAGKKLLSRENAEDYLLVKIDNPWDDANGTAYRINMNLDKGFHAYTWKQVQPAQYSSYETTRQMLLFIMALIVLIAAVNVSAATSMLVVERERDIAVLKTYGTSPKIVRNIFLTGGFLTGVAGALMGIAFGLAFGVNINGIIHGAESLINALTGLFRAEKIRILDPDYYLQTIPISIDWSTVCFIGIFTVICSILAAWFPASRAGRTKPIDLLRKH